MQSGDGLRPPALLMVSFFFFNVPLFFFSFFFFFFEFCYQDVETTPDVLLC